MGTLVTNWTNFRKREGSMSLSQFVAKRPKFIQIVDLWKEYRGQADRDPGPAPG